MKPVFKKKFGKSRVRYIMGSLYRGQTVDTILDEQKSLQNSIFHLDDCVSQLEKTLSQKKK